MIEANLLDFGGIGVLALVMIYFNVRSDKRLVSAEDRFYVLSENISKTVANNTVAINQITEAIKLCPRKK